MRQATVSAPVTPAAPPAADPAQEHLDRRDAQQVPGPRKDLTIAVMARSLRGQFNGVARYTDGLVRALAPRLGDRLNVFVTRAHHGLDDVPARRHVAPFRTPNEYVRAAWEQCIVPVQTGRLQPDVYHSPNYILPLALRCPSVVTVHDVAFLDRSVHRLRSHLYLTALTTLALRKARAVVCVSGFTRDRLIERYPSVTSKTRVVGEGIHQRFAPQSRAAIGRFRKRFDVSRPYVLFTGTIEPRKNVPRLIRAFEDAMRRERLPHDLVLIGSEGWKNAEVRRALAASTLGERIRFIGYVPDEDLAAAYSGAELFVYPSLHEGFGLPPLEAMACGTAVLTSATSALGEVAGPGAATVEPADGRALASEIARLLGDDSARAGLARRGHEHAATFSWERVADQMIGVYQKAAR